jgi:hypothetical protein
MGSLPAVVSAREPAGQRLTGGPGSGSFTPPDEFGQREGPWPRAGGGDDRVSHMLPGHAEDKGGVGQLIAADHPATVRPEVNAVTGHDRDHLGG